MYDWYKFCLFKNTEQLKSLSLSPTLFLFLSPLSSVQNTRESEDAKPRGYKLNSAPLACTNSDNLDAFPIAAGGHETKELHEGGNDSFVVPAFFFPPPLLL